jgi:hypothetical protein
MYIVLFRASSGVDLSLSRIHACLTCSSDFSCCTEQHYGGYDAHAGLMSSQLWAGSTTIGTCDWTILYVDADSSPNFQINPNIAKMGTAWAT